MCTQPLFFLQRTLCISLALLLLSALSAQNRQIAFMIGIGDYPAEGGWQKISAVNDLAVMSASLQQRGFRSDLIFTLTDQAATRNGILQTLQNKWVPLLQKGDVVYFQYSGHGQQVTDDNGDEPDALDEAIVPYDSPLRYVRGVYQGENLIRDDELNLIFTDIRRKIGAKGNLMVVLDACHSGTGTRGMMPARGTDVVMAPEGFTTGQNQASGNQSNPPEFAGIEKKSLAPMVAFFGSAHNQLNFETRDEQGTPLGSLTYALSKKLGQSGAGVSYRGLFEGIRTEMGYIAPRQQPQAEGALDQELLGGRLLETPQYYRTKRWNDERSVAINAGWVLGLNEGSVVGLYPPDTRRPEQATALATGKVIKVNATEAVLELDKPIDQETALGCWAFILEQNFGDLTLGVSLQWPESHPWNQALRQKIASYPVLRLNETPEVFLKPLGNEVELIGAGDATLETFSGNLPPEAAAERIVRRLLAYTQAKFLRKLEAQSAQLQVQFELILVELDPRTLEEKRSFPLDERRDASGQIRLKVGDVFKIKMKNNGAKGAYFTMLDIQPDNVINPMIPGVDETPEEYYIAPGQTLHSAKPFEIGPPAGVEVFKFIVTEQPVDLRPIAQTRGAGTRSNPQPLERLFGDTFMNSDTMSRGGKTINLTAGSALIQSFTFLIDLQ